MSGIKKGLELLIIEPQLETKHFQTEDFELDSIV